MKIRLLFLVALFIFFFSLNHLIGATKGIFSEAILFPGEPWTEWKEFSTSGIGSKVLWRFGFSDVPGKAFSVQLKNETSEAVSFINFFVIGVGSGENGGLRGVLKPGTTVTFKGKSYPPGQPGTEEKAVIKVHMGSFSSGDKSLKQTLTENEKHALNSSEVKKAESYTKNLYNKYIQSVGAGNSSTLNKGILMKYKNAKEAEIKTKSDAISASETSDLEIDTNSTQK